VRPARLGAAVANQRHQGGLPRDVGRFAASLIKPRPLIHINASDWDGTVWWTSGKGCAIGLSICVLGAAISTRHQKGGRNGFLAGSPDCHSCSDRDHGRCIRTLSRVFVNGSHPPGAGSPPLPDAPLFARSRLRLPRSSRARDCQVTSLDDEYRITDAHIVAGHSDVPLTARRTDHDPPISGQVRSQMRRGRGADRRPHAIKCPFRALHEQQVNSRSAPQSQKGRRRGRSE
jgi:hypothetical protein